MSVSLALRMAVCAALLVRWSAPEAAEAAEAASIERCRALNESAQRLLCYDTLFPRVSPSSGSSAPQPLPAAPTASGQAPDDAIQTFGLNGARERAIKGVSATVTELHHEPDGRFVVYLDNGQVWRQIETDDWAPPRKGERVRIRRAALGSYMLETAENLATHVTRIR